MTPQLERLVSLWNASLEGSASARERAELAELLDNSQLTEELSQWQAEQASAEPEAALTEAQWAALDSSVRTRFKGRVLLRRFRPALLALAALAGGCLVYAIWPSHESVPAVAVEEKPYQLTERLGQQSVDEEPGQAPARRRLLSAPPVANGTLLSLEPASVGVGVRMKLHRAVSGEVTVRVLRPDGSLVKELYRQDGARSGLVLSWDGKDASARPAPLGKYLLRLQSPAVVQDRTFHLER